LLSDLLLTGPDSSQVFNVQAHRSTVPKIISHFVLFYALNGGRYPKKQGTGSIIFQSLERTATGSQRWLMNAET